MFHVEHLFEKWRQDNLQERLLKGFQKNYCFCHRCGEKIFGDATLEVRNGQTGTLGIGRGASGAFFEM